MTDPSFSAGGSDLAVGAACPTCLKSSTLCQCAEIEPVANRVFLLILQHPQEQDRELGTARLALSHLVSGKLAVGLSWPNLAAAVGRAVDPKKWAVLYLGSAKAIPERAITVLDRKGVPLPDQETGLADLDGIIVLDGTWSQAKALWWRNAWLLKLRRIVLDIGRPSRYGRLRKEPRRDSVSTLEAAGFLLSALDRNPDLNLAMGRSMERLLSRYRTLGKGQGPGQSNGEAPNHGPDSASSGDGVPPPVPPVS